MNKRTLLTLLLITLPILIFSENFNYKVLELEGEVLSRDVTEKNTEWKNIKVAEILPEKSEIFTGLHSSIAIEFGSGHFIIVKQLSNVILNETKIYKFKNVTDIYLKNGYIIANTTKQADIDQELEVSFVNGKAKLVNGGARIYNRKEVGTFINADTGKIILERTIFKLNQNMTIRPGERCGLLADNTLVDNFDMLKNGLFVLKPGMSKSEGEFYKRLSNPNSIGNKRNKYYKR